MSASDRSWTVAPALLWFSGVLVVALFALDGGVGALADRFTPRREAAPAPVAGPTFTAPPVEVAEVADSASPGAASAAGSPGASGSSGASGGASGRAGGAIDDAALHGAPPTDRSQILALEDSCLDGTAAQCKRWAMDGFYRAVSESKQGKLGRAVRISWYGDSVIATDAIPARFRARFQDELGDGGPGFVYVVPPHRFCGHESIVRTSAGNWITHAISTTQIPDGMYGVGGSTAETDGGRAAIKLLKGTASRVELYYLAQPRGGKLTIAADGKPVTTIDTRSEAKQPGYAAASLPTGATRFELSAAGNVRLFGIDLENAGGAAVDNLGVVSINLKSFDANHAEHFETELAHRAADLVMIMIGANEAQWLGPTDRDTKDYDVRYGKLLAQVRRARPDASCLVVSPTDQAEAKDDGYASRAVMPVLIAAQRAAARTQGCAFYSTYDWMGGKGSAARWFRRGLVGSDFQHLSRAGADRLADGLFGALMLGFQSYAAH